MFKVEAIINNANAYFFGAMHDNDYYIVDGGEDFIVLEHSENKSKIRIYETKSGDLFVNFRNSLDIGYFDHDLNLGDIEVLSFLSKIFEIIHDKNFQHFCIKQKPQNNIEDIIGIVKEPSQTNDLKNDGDTDLKGDIFNIEPITYNNPTQHKIIDICIEMAHLLLYKNNKYGNSALEPKKIFFKGDNVTSILIRLDDKLSRIINNNSEFRTNDIADIIGYLVLLLIAKGVTVSELEKLKD